MAFLASAGTKGVKLRRRKDAKTDVYSWFEITLQDVNVPSQTFTALSHSVHIPLSISLLYHLTLYLVYRSIEIHCFWQDYNLPNLIPDWEEEIEIHYDTLPIKMSEIFENKTEIANSPPEYRYFPETGTLYMKLVVDHCVYVLRTLYSVLCTV